MSTSYGFDGAWDMRIEDLNKAIDRMEAADKLKAEDLKNNIETPPITEPKIKHKGVKRYVEYIKLERNLSLKSEGIRDEAYAPLDSFPRYDKLQASDVCEGYNGTKHHAVNFNVVSIGFLTGRQYTRFKEIKAAVTPTAVIVIRRHVGRCDKCGTVKIRVGFLVLITVGKLVFNREYAEEEY